jgi:hypothetical protein
MPMSIGTVEKPDEAQRSYHELHPNGDKGNQS